MARRRHSHLIGVGLGPMAGKLVDGWAPSAILAALASYGGVWLDPENASTLTLAPAVTPQAWTSDPSWTVLQDGSLQVNNTGVYSSISQAGALPAIGYRYGGELEILAPYVSGRVAVKLGSASTTEYDTVGAHSFDLTSTGDNNVSLSGWGDHLTMRLTGPVQMSIDAIKARRATTLFGSSPVQVPWREPGGGLRFDGDVDRLVADTNPLGDLSAVTVFVTLMGHGGYTSHGVVAMRDESGVRFAYYASGNQDNGSGLTGPGDYSTDFKIRAYRQRNAQDGLSAAFESWKNGVRIYVGSESLGAGAASLPLVIGHSNAVNQYAHAGVIYDVLVIPAWLSDAELHSIGQAIAAKPTHASRGASW